MRLNAQDKKRIQSFYNRRLKKYGAESAESLDWDSKYNQEKRFEVLSKIGNLSGKTILDVGSGLGDLYGYLKKIYKDFDYLGIDIIPESVQQAKIKYPQARYETQEIFDLDPAQKFDYVFASGSLTFSIEQGKKYYYQMIREMYERANIAVGFNMLDHIAYDSDRFYRTYERSEVMEFCKTFARDFTIIVGYLEGDFTIFLFKQKLDQQDYSSKR